MCSLIRVEYAKNNEITVKKNNMNKSNRQKKDKVITFRLSDDDMKRYSKICTDYKLRLSDFIRNTIHKRIESLQLVDSINS
jgi:predicted DNA binding CopG/RHH family protein